MWGMIMAGIAGAAMPAAAPAPPIRPHRAVAPRPAHTAPPQLTPERYREALAPVQDCAAFFVLAGRLPDALPLLEALFVDGVPRQASGETSDRFVGRIVQRLFERLGDPSRLHSSLLLGGMRYRDDEARLILDFPVPFEMTLDGPARGVAPAPAALRAGFEFPAGAVPQPLKVPMTAEQATRFMTGGGRLHILSRIEDYGVDHAPASAKVADRLVRLRPKCAILTNGGVPVAGWQFDGWAAAAGAH